MSRPAQTVRTAALTLVLLAVTGMARAEVPSADWLTPAQAKQALKNAGYSEITKLEADDGHWDGEGIKDGRRMRFDADPKTGAILGEVPVE
ncbi:PepSY domain-containing protein [Methylobacterium sp. Leaf88]|uniref:PepSY domain-containing protein n=1 Tax=Methylobacterium sp. Leaf88 TaxID=1736244 RepID=UPI0006F9CAB3|nr:PepSY domain-containing protein [Methylobacterium sp. Leaf88]KQO78230.1 peptidase [Methylobacterium sp. Leaf88]